VYVIVQVNVADLFEGVRVIHERVQKLQINDRDERRINREVSNH
jgi:hypothetical protein